MNPDQPNRNAGDTWTSDALERGDVAAVMRRVLDDPSYLSSRDFVSSTPLLAAIGFNDANLVEFLLRHGADPNVEVEDGYTCLLTAIESSGPASVRIVAKLIEASADVHRTGTNGWTPLHMAAARGQLEKARLLIGAGADVNRRTEIDAEETPLLEAARQGRSEVVKLLLENGADPAMRDSIHDRTPLETARYAAEGADPDVIAHIRTVDYGPIHAEILASLDIPPEARDMMASIHANLDMVEQYRNAADQCAREGDHEGVIRILGQWNGERRGIEAGTS